MRSKYSPFPPGASAAEVSKAVALAIANVREEMTGFNVRSKTAKPFSSAEEFLRYKLGRAANDAFNKMAPHLKGACVFRVTLTVSRSIRPDRAFHAAGLKTFMKGALREILPSAMAHCANLHVHHNDYLHVDATVVVRDEDVERFRHRARISHTLGWRKRLGVRASTCKIIPQGSLETDLRRSLDYTLRYDRYRCKPEWIKEAIRAIGVARSSGFKKSRSSKYPRTSARTTNPLNGRGNSVKNVSGIALQPTQGTTKNPNVASPPKKKRGPRPLGRPTKRSHPAYRRGFRRDREERELADLAQTVHSAKAQSASGQPSSQSLPSRIEGERGTKPKADTTRTLSAQTGRPLTLSIKIAMMSSTAIPIQQATDRRGGTASSHWRRWGAEPRLRVRSATPSAPLWLQAPWRLAAEYAVDYEEAVPRVPSPPRPPSVSTPWSFSARMAGSGWRPCENPSPASAAMRLCQTYWDTTFRRPASLPRRSKLDFGGIDELVA